MLLILPKGFEALEDLYSFLFILFTWTWYGIYEGRLYNILSYNLRELICGYS